MRTIDELRTILTDILGSNNVYFQPPESYKMQYPCIRFELSSPDQKFADNKTYSYTRCFTLMYIRYEADIEDIPMKIVTSLPMCSEDRTYVSDNLYHTIFTLYF